MNPAASEVHVLPPSPLDEFLSKRGLVRSCDGDRRRYSRLYFRLPITLDIATSLPAFTRPPQTVNTYCCDVSRTGLAFLSACELYPNECVSLTIGGLGVRRMRVARCRRLLASCYEIGAEFILPRGEAT